MAVSLHRRQVLGVATAVAAAALAAWLVSSHREAPGPTAGSGPAARRLAASDAPDEVPLAGSTSCRECHAVFFEKWSTSFHGRAMQPHTGEFARDRLTPQEKPLLIKGRRYRAVVGTGSDHVAEEGPDGTREYPIVQVLGGKNVCYFLTPLARGHLQVLPVAYDMKRKEWFSTTKSAVRHFAGVTNEELDWTDRAYTFNTSCFSCHVSQLATNYEPGTDSYRTVWAEPGVSCETCHGPAAEHVRVWRAAKPGEPPRDSKIISAKSLTPAQRNDMCASCHAKANPLWSSFRPGDRFFDHFDLAALENRDYYPDGRDLGENYTFTSWRMSPCVKAGGIDCVHCHTSSGRFRFADRPNDACLPCHAERVAKVAEHSHHAPDGEGSRCIACHMPMTEFARMHRTDHSMRPPSPEASVAFGSPNACNLCHADRTARWAAEKVRAWHGAGSGARLLREGHLVAAARKGDWSRLPDMLAYLSEPDRDEIVTTSLVRLLVSCPDTSRWPVLRTLAADSSPLVRGAAVAALEDDPGAREILVAATRDETRLVRVRAAAALAGVDSSTVAPADRAALQAATVELERSLLARPDDFASHYNLGNFQLGRGEAAAAAEDYRKAIALRPDYVPGLVNLSMAEARQGRLDAAEEALRRAIEVDPASAAAHFNLGLLLAETDRAGDAKTELGRALELDPHNAAAAYNLAVLVAPESLRQAATLAGRAAEASPEDPRYAWTEAFYREKSGDVEGAVRVLERLVVRHPGYRDGWALLGALHESRGRVAAARAVYERAARTASLPAADRAAFEARARGTSPDRP
jgi:tetratricopeptide (TPR) repeat protein